MSAEMEQRFIFPHRISARKNQSVISTHYISAKENEYIIIAKKLVKITPKSFRFLDHISVRTTESVHLVNISVKGTTAINIIPLLYICKEETKLSLFPKVPVQWTKIIHDYNYINRRTHKV